MGETKEGGGRQRLPKPPGDEIGGVPLRDASKSAADYRQNNISSGIVLLQPDTGRVRSIVDVGPQAGPEGFMHSVGVCPKLERYYVVDPDSNALVYMRGLLSRIIGVREKVGILEEVPQYYFNSPELPADVVMFHGSQLLMVNLRSNMVKAVGDLGGGYGMVFTMMDASNGLTMLEHRPGFTEGLRLLEEVGFKAEYYVSRGPYGSLTQLPSQEGAKRSLMEPPARGPTETGGAVDISAEALSSMPDVPHLTVVVRKTRDVGGREYRALFKAALASDYGELLEEIKRTEGEGYKSDRKFLTSLYEQRKLVEALSVKQT